MLDKESVGLTVGEVGSWSRICGIVVGIKVGR